MMRITAVVFGLFSLAVCMASAAVHVASFVRGSGVNIDEVVGLHLAAMAAFFAMGIHGSILASRIRRRLGTEPGVDEKWMERNIPRWLVAAVGVLFAYALVNAVIFAVSTPGSPQQDAEGYALYSHGRLVRRLATEEEFHDWQRYHARGISGHWMLFSAVPAAYFLVVYPRARRELNRP